MSRNLKDQFAKGTLSSLLKEGGEVEVSRELHSEVRQVDVSFVPDPERASHLEPLGCLGRMAAQPCLLEPFSSPARQRSIRICLMKLEMLRSEQARAARRNKRSLRSIPRTQLWMLFTTCSTEVREAFGAQQRLDDWPEGFFFLPPGYDTAIIGITQLPRTRETLLLRLLGRGETQAQAMAELAALSQDDPLHEIVLRQVRTWIIMMKDSKQRSALDKELAMNIERYAEMAADQERQILERGIQEGIKRGIERGIETGIQTGIHEGIQTGLKEGIERGLSLARDSDRRLIKTTLRLRYGEVDPELERVIPALLDLPPEERATALVTFSREVLLERFSNPR